MVVAPRANDSEPRVESSGPWGIVFHAPRIRGDWERLERRCPENCARCRDYLTTAPMQRYAVRVFPLKGRRHRGAWCYEITSGDRVYYIPDPSTRKVLIYYAGEHPPEAPPPPPIG